MGVQSTVQQHYCKYEVQIEPGCNFPGLVATRAKPGMRYTVFRLYGSLDIWFFRLYGYFLDGHEWNGLLYNRIFWL